MDINHSGSGKIHQRKQENTRRNPADIYMLKVKPLMPDGNKKVTHT